MLVCSTLLAVGLSVGLVGAGAPDNPGQQAAPQGGARKDAPAPKIEPAFRADILRLMDVVGAATLGQQMANSMVDAMLQSMRAEIPDGAIAIVKEVMQAEIAKAFDGPNGLMEGIVNVYAAHLTREDVQGLLAFYTSDLGKRVIAALPAIAQESMRAGQEWGVAVSPRIQQAVMERLKAEGFIK